MRAVYESGDEGSGHAEQVAEHAVHRVERLAGCLQSSVLDRAAVGAR